MTPDPIFVATAAAALGCGLVAGIFFAFSCFVMTALGRLPPAQGVAAMQAINLAVLNPGFFVAFFGSGAGAAVLGLTAALGWTGGHPVWLAAGAAAYLLGCVAVTVARNVPLNDALAALPADSAGAAAYWGRYRRSWTRWNHVRTAASLAAATAFTAALT